MKITDIEAIVLVWPPPEKEFWTALRTIGRVNELVVRIHTDEGIYGVGEAHSQGGPLPRPIHPGRRWQPPGRRRRPPGRRRP